MLLPPSRARKRGRPLVGSRAGSPCKAGTRQNEALPSREKRDLLSQRLHLLSFNSAPLPQQNVTVLVGAVRRCCCRTAGWEIGTSAALLPLEPDQCWAQHHISP